jgi:hypothetical protein
MGYVLHKYPMHLTPVFASSVFELGCFTIILTTSRLPEDEDLEYDGYLALERYDPMLLPLFKDTTSFLSAATISSNSSILSSVEYRGYSSPMESG